MGWSQALSCGRPGKETGKHSTGEHKPGQANSRGTPFSFGVQRDIWTILMELTGMALEGSSDCGPSCFGNGTWGPLPDNHYSSVNGYILAATGLSYKTVNTCPC